MGAYPERIDNVETLEDLLSEPTPHAVETMAKLDGDLMLLGVAGKMGPTLALMARRASHEAGVDRRILGVARFSDPHVQNHLQALGVETICCDLLDPDQLAKLPQTPNIICMFGMKFGSTGQEAMTWAMNCLVPAQICQKFRQSRIVAFSTGNVYGLTPVGRGGSLESDRLEPVGAYAMSCVGRERLYEYSSRAFDIPLAMPRLNYACEMRYGVLVDIAVRVWNEQPVDLAMGYLNAIWQADANAAALSAFAHVSTPPLVLNIAGPEVLSVRKIAEQFGQRFGKRVTFQGVEAADALLSNADESRRLFGPPRVDAEQMQTWIADWIVRGGVTWSKPTHFEARDGKF